MPAWTSARFTSAGRDVRGERQAKVARLDLDLRDSRAPLRGAVARPRRRRPRRATVGSPLDAISLDRALQDDAAVVDDRDLVAGLLDLVEQVRREKHGATFADERADQVAHLEDAGRIETVHRLVEDQQRRIGEQAAGDAEPLAHAERVGLHPVVGAVREPDSLERAVDAAVRGAVARRGDDPEVLAAGQVRVETRLLDDRADAGERLTALGRLRQSRAGSPRRRSPVSARAACGSSSSCRRRSGRGSRTPLRPARRRSTPSTAARVPNFFVSALVSITVSTTGTVRASSAGCSTMRSAGDDERDVRRREQVADSPRSAAACHLERRSEAVCGHEAELACSLRVAATCDQHGSESMSRRVAGAPLDETAAAGGRRGRRGSRRSRARPAPRPLRRHAWRRYPVPCEGRRRARGRAPASGAETGVAAGGGGWRCRRGRSVVCFARTAARGRGRGRRR